MAYKIYQQLVSGMAGKGLTTAENIDDNTLGKSQAELNALFNANLGKTIEFVVVDELPAASAETQQKIYLIPSPNAVTQNVKDEYVTLKKRVEVYEVNSVDFKPSGTPSIGTEGLSAVLTEENGVAVLTVYVDGSYGNTYYPDRGTVVYISGGNVHYIVYDPSSGQSSTAKGWRRVSSAYEQEYEWEQIGSTTVDLSGYPTTQQMNNALSSYATLADLQEQSSTAGSRMDHFEEEIEPEPSSNAAKLWEPVCEVYADQACTTRPVGEVSSVWLRLPTIPSANFAFGDSNYESLAFESSQGDVDITLWGKFSYGGPWEANTPYIVEATTDDDSEVNVESYHKTFYPDGTSE